MNTSQTVMSAALPAGPASTIGGYTSSTPPPLSIAVTSDTVFVGGAAGIMVSFPLTGVPAGGPTMIMQGCAYLTSDTSAAYCVPQNGGSNLAIAGDGTATMLGSANSVYWGDQAGYIKSVAK